MERYRDFSVFLCIIYLLLSGLNTQSPAATVYVSNATDLATACSTATGGDKIIVTENISTSVSLTGNGSSGNPIVIKAEVMNEITFSNEVSITGDYITLNGFNFNSSGRINIEGSYNRITKCIIDNSTQTNWVYVHFNCREIEIDHCLFQNKRNDINGRLGPLLRVNIADNSINEKHYIHHNHFRNVYEGYANNYETVQLEASEKRNTVDDSIRVEYNYFDNCDNLGNGEGEIVSVKTSGNIFRYNVFYNCGGSLVFRHGNRNTAEGNYFLGNNRDDSQGIRIQGTDHKIINNYFANVKGKYALAFNSYLTGSGWYDQVKHAQVLFNTWVDCDTCIWIQEERSSGPADSCTFANNVFWAEDGIVMDEDYTMLHPTYEGNIYYCDALGFPDPGGFTETDPLLTENVFGIYIPQSNSPVVNNAAGTYSFVTEDIFGNSRSAGYKDIGAVEYPSTYMPRYPISAALVGPPQMVGYWPFDGDAQDESGNSTHGTITGAGYTGSQVCVGLEFDGSDDYVTLANPDGILNLKYAVTMEAWIYLTTLTGGFQHIYDNSSSHCLSVYDGKLAMESSGGWWYSAATSLNAGEWYHVVGTYSGTEKKLYINGELELSASQMGSMGSGSTSRISHPSYEFNGIIDEVKVYTRALSAEEIADAYEETPKPVGIWSFDNSADDKSGYDHDATLYNGPSYTSAKVNQGLNFDGSDDYAIASNSDGKLTITQAISIETWINGDTFGAGYHHIYDKNASHTLSIYDGKVATGGAGGWWTPGTTALNTGQWYHLVWTYDGSQKVIYINGAEAANTSASGTFSSGYNAYISHPTYRFDGVIDELKIYDRALTEREVELRYSGSSSISKRRIEPAENPVPENDLPNDFALFQNYPNPFNPETTISYNLPKQGEVNIKIYNLMGQEVLTLVDKQQAAGRHQAKWRASHLPSGIYICRLRTAEFTATRKLILQK